LQHFKQIFHHSQHILFYGGAIGVLVSILKWLQWKYLITDNSSPVYLGLMALFFTFLGTWIAMQLTTQKTIPVFIEKEVYPALPNDHTINETELKKFNLTAREYEVLRLLARGTTNAEIAEKLFLSLSTVKTHVSSLFVKMDVKNRTQAVEKANRLKITP
jgi:NarL family two-component system response regulator LiaR